MWSLLLLLLVGTTTAQESGDFAQENDQLIKATNDEGNDFDETLDVANNEDDEKDFSLSQECELTEPDFTEQAENATCPNKGTCSYHVFTACRPFFQAQRVCRCRRGNLSSIHNCAENNFLRAFLRRTAGNSAYVWIGVWKRNSCFPYRNIDGSRLNYRNWACGQRRARGRWCTAMNTHTGQWVTLGCSTRLPFVCTY